MTYLTYVVAAYAVFAAVLLWDYVSPRLQLRQQLRVGRLRGARQSVRANDSRAPLRRD